jgi:hypothetical protein
MRCVTRPWDAKTPRLRRFARMLRNMRLWKKFAIGLGVLLVLALGGFTYMVGGPRNLIGMLRYDQREEGTLKVGDRAPDVALVALDGTTPVRLSSELGGKPTVLVFGSFT